MLRLFLVLLVSVAAHAAPSIVVSTVSGWDGSNPLQFMGPAGTPTYGETLTTPVGAVSLQDFSFFVRNTGPDPLLYQAIVATYSTATRSAGSILFQSGQLSLAPTSGFSQVSINTGNVAVTPGQDLVYFFTSLNSPSNTAATSWGLTTIGGTPATDRATLSGATTFAALFVPNSNAWDLQGIFPPLAFTATFDDGLAPPVAPEIDPQSGTLPLCVMSALLLLACDTRRRG